MYEQLGPNQSVNSRDYAPIHIPRSRHKCSCSGVSVFGTPSMIVKNAFSNPIVLDEKCILIPIGTNDNGDSVVVILSGNERRRRICQRDAVDHLQSERDLSSPGMYLQTRQTYQAPACIYKPDRPIKLRHVYTKADSIYLPGRGQHLP